MGDVVNYVGVDDQVKESIPFFDEYLKVDRGTPPEYLFERSTEDLGNEKFSTDRYISREWHELEKEHMWFKVWNMVCRENDIPNPGDQLEHTIVDQPVAIVRTETGEIKAFANACAHRGTPLVWGCKNAPEIKCPFHGWSYNLDGSLKNVPCKWDFPELTPETHSLKPLRVETWAGFVWVNLDHDAEPLEKYIPEKLRVQVERFWPGRNRKVAHVRHIVDCNWKLAVEGFNEIYHVPIIHPETIYSVGDYNAQYDYYGPHLRMCFTWATPSPLLGEDPDAGDIIEGMFVGEGAVGSAFADALGREYKLPTAEPGDTLLDARRKISDMMRDLYKQNAGLDLTDTSDTEVLDGYMYLMFPNFNIWGGYTYTVCYRWLPNGNDPESCIYEAMLFQIIPEGEDIEPDVPIFDTPHGSMLVDQPGTAGSLGFLLDEDFIQLRRIQEGYHSREFTEVTFSNEQERNLRNFQQHIERYIGKRK